VRVSEAKLNQTELSRKRHVSFLTIGSVLSAAAIFAAQGWVNSSLRDWRTGQVRDGMNSKSDAMSERRWNAQLFKAMTFGHLPAAVDWLWLQALLDQNLDHVRPGQHFPVYYDLDLLTDLDPLFYDAYHAGSDILAVIHNDGPGAKNILLKGMKVLKDDVSQRDDHFKNRYWSHPWGLPMMLAYVDLFELNDLPSASSAFIEAAKIPGVPPYVLSLQARLEKPGGQYQVGLHLVDYMLLSARGSKNQKAIDQLEAQKASLEVGRFLFETNLEYQKSKHYPPQDPWGGTLSLDSNGRIVSSTPHERVFGLD
jgi:hypothetical protein